VKNAVAALGQEAKSEGIYQVLLDLDSEGSGDISFEQFIHLMTPKLLRNDSRENIDMIFTLFDSEKSGFISIKSLRRAVK
jgi:Ca2+-binding EF-hand superfamily protein